MSDPAGDGDVIDIDGESIPRRDVAVAVATTRHARRREDLRQEIQRATLRITPKDAGVALFVGAVGAIPATEADERIGAWLMKIPGVDQLPWTDGRATARQAYDFLGGFATRPGGGFDFHKFVAGPGVAEQLPLYGDFFERLRAGQVGVDELGARFHGAQTNPGDADLLEAFLVPDGEDIFGAGLVRLLSDQWTKRRGWKKGDQAFHEFRALTYGTTAAISLALNPNPIAIGLAGWHFARAMYASHVLTEQVLELSRLAVADAQQVMAEWDALVVELSWQDEQTRRAYEAPRARGYLESQRELHRLTNAFGGDD